MVMSDNSQLTGLEKARSVADQIRQDGKQEQETRMVAQAEVKPESIKPVDSEIANLYANYSAFEAEDALDRSGGFPVLTIHTTQSTKNELESGNQPKVGNLFHKGSKQEFTEVIANILYVKECRLPDYNDKKVLKSNYVVAGIITALDLPFMLFAKGMSYNKIWKLSEKMRPYRKKDKAPKWAFNVRIYTSLEKPIKDFKEQYVIDYDLARDQDGNPIYESDPQRAKMLAGAVETAKDAVDRYVAKELEKNGFNTNGTDASQNSKDIPF